MLNYPIGTLFYTRGGWYAVCCTEYTMFHYAQGGKLYTHNPKTGEVTSQTVGSDFDLTHIMVPIK